MSGQSVAVPVPPAYAPCDERDCELPQFSGRIAKCNECEHRRDNVCALDGLMVTIRATRKASRCYAHLWDEPDPKHTPSPALTVQGPKDKDKGQTINVVIISPQLAHPGGAEEWMASLGRHLPWISGEGQPQVKVNAYVITRAENAHPQKATELRQFAPIVIHHNRDKGSFEVDSAVAAADVVIVWGLGDFRHYVRNFKGPVVWISHGQCHWTIRHIVEAESTGLVTHWAAVSEAARAVFPDKLRDQVAVIENGVEPTRCFPVFGRAAQRAAWGLTDDQIAVLHVGRLNEDKRPEALAMAIAALPTQYVGIYVGEGCQGDRYRKRCRQIAGDRVRFVGSVYYVGDAFAAGDVNLCASKSEGYGLARMEGLIAGIPTVSTPTGNLPALESVHGPLAWPIPIGAWGREMAKAIETAVTEAPTDPRVARARDVALSHCTVLPSIACWHRFLVGIVMPADDSGEPFPPIFGPWYRHGDIPDPQPKRGMRRPL